MNKKLGAKDRIMITFRPELFYKFVLEELYYKIVLSVLKFIMIFSPYFGMPLSFKYFKWTSQLFELSNFLLCLSNACFYYIASFQFFKLVPSNSTYTNLKS